MYRNEGTLDDNLYRENHIDLHTREDALREIQNIISRFDHKLKSISEKPQAQTEENISLINRAKKHRLMMQQALQQIEETDEDGWAKIRPEVQESFAAAKQEAIKY